jgi:drug/metabolite transporter (DMT)-like permease
VAAVAHASWNLFSKQAATAGAARFVWLMSAAAAVIYAPAVVVSVVVSTPHLSARSWVFMAGTAVLQTGYFLFLQRGYRVGDLSLVYPVGRGTGALLAALAGILILGERPGPAGLVGIVLLVAGVIVLGLPDRGRQAAAGVPATSVPGPEKRTARALPIHSRAAGESPASRPAAGERPTPGPAAGERPAPGPATGERPAHGRAAGQPGARASGSFAPAAVLYALATGVFIAGYTLWDKVAVTTVGNPPLLQDYASLIGMSLALMPFALADPATTAVMWRTYRRQVLGAAVLSPLAYILVLAAMSFTSVSAVAPAREISVLFGVLLGRRLLGEGGLARRLTGAAAIVIGIIAVALG